MHNPLNILICHLAAYIVHSYMSSQSIKGLLVTLDVAEQQSLFIMLAADGTINRLGTGSVNNTDLDLFIGRTSPEVFEELRRQVSPGLLEWIGQFADPSPQGPLCKLTVGFQHEDGRELVSQWKYGAESQGPPPAIAEFVIAAVKATSTWHEQQKQMAKQK